MPRSFRCASSTLRLAKALASPPMDEVVELVDDELLEDELLVEEISIDGMCGVY
jgi:mycofactocin precursor